jgi:hypothetical protein
MILFYNQNMTRSLLIPSHLLRNSELWICDHSVTVKKRLKQNTRATWSIESPQDYRCVQHRHRTMSQGGALQSSIAKWRVLNAKRQQVSPERPWSNMNMLPYHLATASLCSPGRCDSLPTVWRCRTKTLQYRTIPQTAYHFSIARAMNFIFWKARQMQTENKKGIE